MYRVVLTIVETNEKEFKDYLDTIEVNEITMSRFIYELDIMPEVRRIYMTAKNFESYYDALRCYEASLREFDFNKKSYQYFKILRIDEYRRYYRTRIKKITDELTGKVEEG